jgi:hypothetical protein
MFPFKNIVVKQLGDEESIKNDEYNKQVIELNKTDYPITNILSDVILSGLYCTQGGKNLLYYI